MNIPVSIDGRILNGQHAEMRVRVEEDPQSTSGFIIYTWWKGSDGLGPNSAYEDRVESSRMVESYIAERGWTIAWQQASHEKKA